jgi:hypothetical protein
LAFAAERQIVIRTGVMIAEILKAGAVLSIVLGVSAGPYVLGCSPNCGDCVPDYEGLVIWTGAPVTAVTLSGAACTGGRFRCEPADFDNMIHDPCTKVQLQARAEGLCVVDLTVGGSPVRIERQMSRRPPGCCGGFIGEANHEGFIDLTANVDASADLAADLTGS